MLFRSHVYTVLSIIVYCNALNATADFGYIIMKGYDNHGGASAQEPNIARFNIQVGETFVWNDKFSFNGFEPSGTDVFSTAAHQTANAAQAGSVAQELKFDMTSSGDDFDITVNMSLTEIHSMYNFDNTLWLGGNGVILVFDREENYWRTLGEERGIPESDITSMVGDSNYVWIGSYFGIKKVRNNFCQKKKIIKFL